MKKIKTLFVIDRETNLATNKIPEENKWVLNGEGIATVKFDGSSCMIKDSVLFKRWNRKLTKNSLNRIKRANKKGITLEINESFFKKIPTGSIPCNDSFDPVTFHFPYWIPVTQDNSDAFHREAFDKLDNPVDGTYELCGEKVRCNPHNIKGHILLKHGDSIVELKDRKIDTLKSFLKDFNGEGLVFHHKDGRMLKLRKKDFNFEWNTKGDPRS